ncbi:MAG TPA: DUF5701 family protein [Trueperaceae bacterium]|nr:DUF5701 family protein [Trueperaceae bacterium]
MAGTELEAQVEHLAAIGYPKLLGISRNEFMSALEPLRKRLPEPQTTAWDGSFGHVPFVIVIASPRAPVKATLPLVTRRELTAIERLYPREPADFSTIDSVSLPDGDAYLLIDVDRGSDTLNATPDDAFETIRVRGRTPLTIAEGIAILTHYPEFLQPNNCFSLLASRAGDKRVPALWLSEKRPKLGWCWAGNPHTWLGSASCGNRVGAEVKFG